MSFTDKIDNIKANYPQGTRIQLDHMEDSFAPIPDGMTGTVTFVDDAGTLHMRWDNGRSLGAVPGVDAFHKIGGDV